MRRRGSGGAPGRRSWHATSLSPSAACAAGCRRSWLARDDHCESLVPCEVGMLGEVLAEACLDPVREGDAGGFLGDPLAYVGERILGEPVLNETPRVFLDHTGIG